MKQDNPAGIRPFHGPAGGWQALKAVAENLARQQVIALGGKTLLRANQPDGFDCPGCAWPDPKHTSSFEFCENGAKAVAWEATSKRVPPEFFAAHSVTELATWSDYALENEGRLTHPLAYDPATDKYLPVPWDEAFQRIGAVLKALPDPNMLELYTSGRASNEAAFLYQLFGRLYGTNNFPDCSNMCHEPSSVGLPESIGVGKGTAQLADFDQADAIFSFGHNPGTNHPRMMTTLHNAAKRGVPIVVFNPLRERALERFTAPQNPFEMLTLTAQPIGTYYYQVKVGGDLAALKGVMKAILDADDAAVAAGRERPIDVDFIATHTAGFEEFRADLNATSWDQITGASGLSRADLETAARVYMGAKAVVVAYGMGLTQHCTGTGNVRYLVNLLLLRGNIGRPGTGLCPVRGHSNVQGNRTVGITERPKPEFLDRLGDVFGFEPPRKRGHSVVETIAAMRDGRSRVLISLGGNFAQAAPDPAVTHAALRGLALTVGIHTKLNRSHLVHGREAFVLPCLGRTELDLQANGPQSITVEDSMSMVHASIGFNTPASPQLRSEPAIIVGIAKATLPPSRLDWDALVADYDRIRERIERVFPEFADYNQRIRKPGGFHLFNPAAVRIWRTPSGKANFYVFDGVNEDPVLADGTILRLSTIRSHDQYNTTIYGLDDRYRGVFGRRDVVFLNADDMAQHGILPGDLVDLATAHDPDRVVRGLTAVEYKVPRGSCAAYYPEMNPLVALSYCDAISLTPGYKSIPVRVRPAGGAGSALT